MISKNEILEIATQTGMQSHVIEKDYVLGWLIAGINQHPVIGVDWVFKGGTCLKKCYFETYRFSEDLDFTIRAKFHINEDLLQDSFTEISDWIYEESGIELAKDRQSFEIYTNPRGIESCQGRIYYKGPATFSGKHSMPRIKLDLTSDEILADDPISMPVRHVFSDSPENGINIQCYSYAEVFAEKIRALKERTRPRDLYDVINLFRRPESREVADEVRAILGKKCEFKGIRIPVLEDLDQSKEVCASGWNDQLSHQLQILPPFEIYWGELSPFFSWLETSELDHESPLADISAQYPSEITTLLGEPANQFSSALERVRFAAVNRLCVELDYIKDDNTRSTYLIEPYSLRTTINGNMLLYGVKLPAGEIRSFRTDRIERTSVTGQPFTPRYLIDFIPEGPVWLSSRQISSRSRTQQRHELSRTSRPSNAVKYVFQCPHCEKLFTRTTRNSSLNAHKDKNGYPCAGRTGLFVKRRN